VPLDKILIPFFKMELMQQYNKHSKVLYLK